MIMERDRNDINDGLKELGQLKKLMMLSVLRTCVTTAGIE